MAVARDLGRVKVRMYANPTAGTQRNKPYSNPRMANHRTIVDFDELETTMRYLVLSPDGGTFRLGVETLVLDWKELRKLSRIIAEKDRELSQTAT